RGAGGVGRGASPTPGAGRGLGKEVRDHQPEENRTFSFKISAPPVEFSTFRRGRPAPPQANISVAVHFVRPKTVVSFLNQSLV
ncbi:unnamed protein product, partial [Gulo gulo]